MAKQFLAGLEIDTRLKPADRALLETRILPWLAGLPETGRVLFVGCEWYTRGYARWFCPESYWTIDSDPEKKPFGAPRLHIVDSMANLDAHFSEASLDLVICNGVIGWGLDEPREIAAAIAAVYGVLKPGGLFLIGWNDVPEHRPLSFADIPELHAFAPAIIAPFGVTTLLTGTPNRHTFNLYAKPGGTPRR